MTGAAPDCPDAASVDPGTSLTSSPLGLPLPHPRPKLASSRFSRKQDKWLDFRVIAFKDGVHAFCIIGNH